MKTDSLLVIIFIAIGVTFGLNRFCFYDYFKLNGLNTKPISKYRNLTIVEIVNYYLSNTDLSEEQQNSLKQLKCWEIINFALLPAFFLFALLLSII